MNEVVRVQARALFSFFVYFVIAQNSPSCPFSSSFLYDIVPHSQRVGNIRPRGHLRLCTHLYPVCIPPAKSPIDFVIPVPRKKFGLCDPIWLFFFNSRHMVQYLPTIYPACCDFPARLVLGARVEAFYMWTPPSRGCFLPQPPPYRCQLLSWSCERKKGG